MRESVRWQGCYGGSYDLWTGESIAHPAKMAPGLAFKILAHLEERGLLHDGDTVLDMMCGTGTTLLAAMAKGYEAVGVELEERFAGFARENVARLAAKLGCEPATVVQGDARQLDSLLGQRGLVGVFSPPYLGNDKKDYTTAEREERRLGEYSGWGKGSFRGDYAGSRTPGQIGNLRDGPRTVGMVSPPYGDGAATRRGDHPVQAGSVSDVLSRTYDGTTHGTADGQIGALPDKPRVVGVTSPPYGDTMGDWKNRDANTKGHVYADKDWANIGNLPEPIGDGSKADWWRRKAAAEAPETYLDAMAQVYAAAAKVCDVLVVVTKNPTRNGALRRLDKDTLALLREAGFTPVCYHQAMLFKVEERLDLFGANHRKPRGRIGFFKMMQFKKGQPVADHEDIFVCVRRQSGVSEG